MAEFTRGNEKCISAREPIVFENKTESKYEVCAGIVFHKSGIYEVSVIGNRTIVCEVLKRKPGKWVCDTCSKCGKNLWDYFHYSEDGAIIEEPNFCPNCGADMRGEQDESI